MYLNEKNKGIHVIDYSRPSEPVNRGFIPIPGNRGLSIQNDFIYADCNTSLFVFKISSAEDIRLENSVPNVFMPLNGYDTTVIKVTWIHKDTTVSTEYYNNQLMLEGDVKNTAMVANAPSNSTGASGGGSSLGSSMAVFTIVNDHLYVVDNRQLISLRLTDPIHPAVESKQTLGWDIETLFPFKDKLFIGSMNGMFIYGLENPASPNFISRFDHVRVCDPVIADDKYAFVTLRNGTGCGGSLNQMDILNIEDLSHPRVVKSLAFSNPHGLSKDGNVLFVCDGLSGLKVLDASDVNNLNLMHTVSTASKAVDVVAYKQKAFVMLENAVQIYSYNQQFDVELIASLGKN